MKTMLVSALALGALLWVSEVHAQSEEAAPESEVAAEPAPSPPPAEKKSKPKPRGFIGGMLGAGFAVSGEINSGVKADVDASLLFALRGGLLVGDDHRGVITFEVAPVTNKLFWPLQPTASGFVSFGRLKQIRKSEEWSWLWKVGVGMGGGLDYRFLVGAQLDILTFNYEMRENLWIDFGIPTVRFYIETASNPRYVTQFVFPLGITFTL